LVFGAWTWVKEETRCIAEDAIVDVCIFHDRTGVMPFTIEDETDAKSYGQDQNMAERRKSGHDINQVS
jgi:hypothetical protein